MAGWRRKVTLVEVKQVDLADQIIRATAGQAERPRRAKVIQCGRRIPGAENPAMAAAVIQRQPAAMQVRYLQTLVEIGAEHNTTIVFPRPIDLITSITQGLTGRRRPLRWIRVTAPSTVVEQGAKDAYS